MTDNVVFSRQGIAFTAEALTTMRDWSAGLRRENPAAIIIWTVAFDSHGEPIIGLCADYHPAHPLSTPDEVEDVAFYWYADPPGIDLVRKHCIDAGFEKKSRLLDSPADETKK